MKIFQPKFVRRLLKNMGYEVSRYDHRSHPKARRFKLISSNQIDLVLDVGANIGRYATDLRENNYTGKIISFEPVSETYRLLQKCANFDSGWEAINIAIGDCDGEALINVARRSGSSSLLDILPSHIDAASSSEYVRSEKVQVRKLDTIFSDYSASGNNIFLKIDTQGFEKNVILGAHKSLSYVRGIQLEASLIPLYEGEALLPELLALVKSYGFQLMSVEPGLSNPGTGQLLQLDCLFFRESSRS